MYSSARRSAETSLTTLQWPFPRHPEAGKVLHNRPIRQRGYYQHRLVEASVFRTPPNGKQPVKTILNTSATEDIFFTYSGTQRW